MFSSSGAPSALEKYLRDLQSDVSEQQRQIKKEQEIINSLQEDHRRKKEGVKKFQKKSRELDEAVKRLHGIYLKQREAIERVKETNDSLDEQIKVKRNELGEKKEENTKRGYDLSEKLNKQKEKFEQYMVIYRRFPMVPEFLDLQDRYQAALHKEQEMIAFIDALENKIASLKIDLSSTVSSVDSPQFDSLHAWGYALAIKYQENQKRKQLIDSVRHDIAKVKDEIATLEEQIQEKAERLKRSEELQLQAIAAQATAVSSTSNTKKGPMTYGRGENTPSFASKLGNLFKMPTVFKNFSKLQNNLSSPFRTSMQSVPNLQATIKSKKLDPQMEVDNYKDASVLSRSQSMSSLAKGYSGTTARSFAAIKPPPISPLKVSSLKPSNSLQKWLSSERKTTVFLKEHSEHKRELIKMPVSEAQTPTVLPVPEFHDNAEKKQDELQEATLTTDGNELSNIAPCTSISSTPTTTLQSPGLFNFADIYKSTGDDFNMTSPIFDAEANKAESSEGSAYPFSLFHLGVTSPDQDSAGQDTAGKSDFQFAVPSAPPPGRKDRHGNNADPMASENEGRFQKPNWPGPAKSPSSEDGKPAFLDAFSSPVNNDPPSTTTQSSLFSPAPRLSFSFAADDFKSPNVSFDLFGGGDHGQDPRLTSQMETDESSFSGFPNFGETTKTHTSPDGFASIFKFGDTSPP